MGRLLVLTTVAFLVIHARAQENRRMADIRGQSFGLENFLMQPFNIAAQAEREQLTPRRRDHVHMKDPFSVEFEVQNDNFEMRKIVPASQRIPPLFDLQEQPSQNIKPVHEYPDSLPPKRRYFNTEDVARQTFEQSHKRRGQAPEVRRPLERPAEFHVSISDEPTPPQSQPPAQRPRKRVMKRRRKKPTTPQPETFGIEDVIFTPIPPKHDETEELELNIFTEDVNPEKGGAFVENYKPETSSRLNQADYRGTIRRPPLTHTAQALENGNAEEIRRPLIENYKTDTSSTIDHESQHESSKRPLQVQQLQPIDNASTEEQPEIGGELDENYTPEASAHFTQANHREAARRPTHNQPIQTLDNISLEQRPLRRTTTPSNKRKRGPSKSDTSVAADFPPEENKFQEELALESPSQVPKTDVEDLESIKTDPITMIPTTENPQQPTNRLKTLLKQQNGQLSLSELLQTQNLSLSDFLKGNPGALSALGAKKVNSEKTSLPEPPIKEERQKFQPSRQQIPKISSKSRPFSKPTNNSKPLRRPVDEEEQPPVSDLPKKLDIVEVTSDRPTYNGFTPKNPRTKPPSFRGDYKPNFSREKIEEQASESLKSIVKAMKEDESEEEKNSEEPTKSTTRIPVFKPFTPSILKETTSGEQKVVPPKRFGEYRPKLRIDRRKPTSEGTTEGTTVSESPVNPKVSATTEEVKPTLEPKYKVRIPFMSVNNPEISVILPQKRNVTSTEKPKDIPRFPMRERINLFKRLNQEDKQNEITEVKVPEATDEPTTTQELPTETLATTTKKQVEATIKTTVTTTTEEASTVTENDEHTIESSDEIVELLRMGNNAKRLQRILETRNMTIDELLEKRASSSKHPNVTYLFGNKTENPVNAKGKVSELRDNFHPTPMKSTTTTTTTTTKVPLAIFSEFPKFNNDEKEKVGAGKPIQPQRHHETNSFDELFVDESIIRPIKIPFESEEKRESKAYETKSERPNKISPKLHINLSPSSEGSPKHPMPIWNVDEKSIYSSNPYGYPTYDLNKNLAGNQHTTEQNRQESTMNDREKLVLESVKRTQDSNLKLKHNINEILKEQVEIVKEVHAEEKTFIPPAVKSAIIASGVVMGIALLVFVAIFAACGWKQRQFRLRARSSILNDSLSGTGPKMIKATGTLSPISFKRSSLYKKSIEFEDSDSSISTSSNTSSYLWNTLKHTFQSRNSTLKNRQEKEEKIQERENRSRRNTLTREDSRSRRNTLIQDDGHRDNFLTSDLPRRNTLTRDEHRRDSFIAGDIPRRNTLTRDEIRRDSVMSRDTLSREDTRRSSIFRDETRRLNSLLRENERCSFKKIDPDRNIIQTSVNFKRGGINGSSRHFDSCDHFN